MSVTLRDQTSAHLPADKLNCPKLMGIESHVMADDAHCYLVSPSNKIAQSLTAKVKRNKNPLGRYLKLLC